MIHRQLTQPLLRSLADTPVVLVAGARQTGKSTLVRHLAETDFPAGYVTLDHITSLGAAKRDPESFLNALKTPVILDEIQRAPELLLPIKARVDGDRRPGMFLLTGSANVLLLPRISETLTGRMEPFTLWPLSMGEQRGQASRFVDSVFDLEASPPRSLPGFSDRWEHIALGGYPEVLQREAQDRRDAWFRAYLTTIVQREIRDMANIDGLLDLPRLLSLLASRVGGLSNHASLSRDSGLPQTTLKRYLSLLEAAYLIVYVPAWSRGPGKRLTRSPKIYLTDTGMLCHLLQLDSSRLSEHTLSGRILETFVLMEIRKQQGWSREQPAVSHYRTSSGREVDFVLEQRAGNCVGIEVKASGTVRPGDFAGLQDLAARLPRRFLRGIVLYGGTETVAFGDRMEAWPLQSLWEPWG